MRGAVSPSLVSAVERPAEDSDHGFRLLRRTQPHARRWPAWVAVALPLLPASQIVLITDHRDPALLALASWSVVAAAVVAVRRGAPKRSLMTFDLKAAAALCALTGLASLAGLLTPGEGRVALLVVLLAAAGSLLVRMFVGAPTRPRRVVLVGQEQDVAIFVAAGSSRDVVAGWCQVGEARPARAVDPGLPVPTTTKLATLPDLVQVVDAEAVLVLPSSTVDADLVRNVSWLFEGMPVTVGVVCPVSSVGMHRLRASVSDGSTVLEIGPPRAHRLAHLVKATVDRVGALVLLTLVAPLLVVLWAAVRLDSRGPGFFLQTRVGKDGRPFRMVKLRTMRTDAEEILDSLAEANEADGVLFKIRRDARVTRVGYWLRRYSLDELPQLLNILRGEMSLVGPRPALPTEVAAYDDKARRRLAVKPGLTGLWQVSGRSDLSWEESLRLDLYYTDNWRLVDDLTIAARTLSAVTSARGAY